MMKTFSCNKFGSVSVFLEVFSYMYFISIVTVQLTQTGSKLKMLISFKFIRKGNIFCCVSITFAYFSPLGINVLVCQIAR